MASNNSTNGSKKRPGTIDYTKWENFEDSDDDDDGRGREDDDNDEARQRYYQRRRQEVSHEARQNKEQHHHQQQQQQCAAAVIETGRNSAAVVRLPDLKTLQDEWGIGKDDTDGVNNNHDDNEDEDSDKTQCAVQECSSCKHVGRSLKSCSRCKMVW